MKTKLVIFGISGDLSKRKLLPALQRILATGEFNDLEIIGVSRRQFNKQEIFTDEKLRECGSLFFMDIAEIAEYKRLKSQLSPQNNDQVLIYLSVPPAATRQIVTLLGEAGLAMPTVKLLLEKPFGVDLASAQDMHTHISRFFKEEQVYRIDHYLAKEMAQNIVAFRTSNALFSYVWNKDSIERIEVIATETLGIEGRVQFYEQTGALRDLVQGHLMQLLSLVLMQTPGKLDWSAVPQLRLQALRTLSLSAPRETHRAQYEGYQKEVSNPGSLTETFVSLELMSKDPRWQNVPITLTTGKALDRKVTEIRVIFKKIHHAKRNQLIFRIQPNEGVEIDVFAKQPGYDRQLKSHLLSFTYPEEVLLPDAYEQVIVDAIRSHKSLFTSNEEVLESWRILQPVLDIWNLNNTPLPIYSKGVDYYAVKKLTTN